MTNADRHNQQNCCVLYAQILENNKHEARWIVTECSDPTLNF